MAIECIDDPFVLLDEQPVPVAHLWGDLLCTIAGERVQTLTLVAPSWWPVARIDAIADAARCVTDDVVVTRRATLLGSATGTVVEFAEEFVVVAAPGADTVVLVRDDESLIEHLGAPATVLLDVPAGVAAPAPSLIAALRSAAIPIGYSDSRQLQNAAAHSGPDPPDPPVTAARRRRRLSAVPAGAVLSAVILGGAWWPGGPSTGETSTVLLVEGRAAVRVPAAWTVEHITSGPGSARVRVAAPGGSPALHITQADAEVTTSVEQLFESLRRALRAEPPGVFVDFDPDGDVGGRPAVTYREVRADSETFWAVVADGALRIAVGCQSALGRRASVWDACVRAVESAHARR